MDTTSEVAKPVVWGDEIDPGPDETDVSSPSEPNDEVVSEEVLHIEEAEAVVGVIVEEGIRDGTLVVDDSMLVISVAPAISVIAESLHTDEVALEITAPEVIALAWYVLDDPLEEESAPEIDGELDGCSPEAIGCVTTELHIEDGPVVGPGD